MLLLRCLTGSRLYGTVRDESTADWDYIEVWSENIKSRHSIVDGNDVQSWSLSTFMKIVMAGGHNALDICYAPRNFPEVDLLTEMRLSVRVNPWVCWPKLNKTIQSFLDRGDAKGRLHTMRLGYNMEQIAQHAWFDPTEWARNYDWRNIE